MTHSDKLRRLTLPLKGVYFDQIKSGEKTLEYRAATPFWEKRLVGREYDRVILTRGYPRRDDAARRLVLPWRGFVRQRIQHPHFGPKPVDVFAIAVDASLAIKWGIDQ